METPRILKSLDGPWRLVLDPEDVGKTRHWESGAELPESIDVRVPSVWDRWVPDFDGVGWYFRTFDLDDAWSGKHITLQFDAADYYAEVWVNGTRLGEHEGGYTPFAFDVSETAKTGENLVAVRIVDPHGPGGYGGFLPKQIPCAKENHYYSFAGIWGSVALLGRHAAHITDVYVQPDIRRKRVTATVTTSQPGTLRLRIADTPHAVECEAGRRAVFDFPDFNFWAPETPVLYTLDCELVVDGSVVDATSVRFGMREFTVKENRFCLNNKPIAIKGVLHQPDYPRSFAAPESPDLARKELELAKAAGFNFVRLHIKTAPKITLDLADELGLLIYEEPPIGWIEKSPLMQERCEREVREMILRDRNHPSVVIWGMLNESGNAGSIVDGGAQTIKDDLCKLARELDPSRMIVDDSGGMNQTREPTRFMRPYHDDFEAFDDLRIYQRGPVDREIALYYEHSGDPGRLAFLSEFGFGGMEDLPDVLAQYGESAASFKDARFLQDTLDAIVPGFSERNLDSVFGDFSKFAAAARELQSDTIKHQIEAIRLNAKLSGYCLTQWCDAGREFGAGILDRWRRPKPVYATLKQAQVPLLPAVQIPKTNLVPREEVHVSVVLVNDERIETRADLSLQVVGPTNQVLWKKKRNIKIPRGGKEIWAGTISASGSTGIHRFVVRLMQGHKVIGQNAVEIHVVEPIAPCDVDVHVVDPNKEWRERCLALAKPGERKASMYVVPPLGNSIRGYPEDDLGHVLGEVRGGAVALVFAPPDDWNAFAERVDESVTATNKDAVGACMGVYHYVKIHPVFDGLPARCLMRQPYRNVVAPKTFIEAGDEDICGAFDMSPAVSGNYGVDASAWWGNDLLVRRYGSGRIVFTHLRVLENLGNDPVADRIFVNMLRHFSRRSVPSAETLPAPQDAIDWLRREKLNRVRQWMVIGMFPNWGGRGHETPYPPEKAIDLEATYPGWYRAIEWRRWYSLADYGYLIDLQAAFTPVYEYYPRFDYGTGYAYAEFNSVARQAATIHLQVQNATKVWLNGALVHESNEFQPYRQFADHRVSVNLKQGRNTVLVKVSKVPGEFQFSFDIESATRDPLHLKWWK